jgi:SAM-dependent methyltransferase
MAKPSRSVRPATSAPEHPQPCNTATCCGWLSAQPPSLFSNTPSLEVQRSMFPGSWEWPTTPITSNLHDETKSFEQSRAMNWSYIRCAPWLDTRAKFVAGTQRGGALLDLGSSDGETLGHMAELRPDLRFFAADKMGAPEKYPKGCQFARVDFERDKLPWPDGSMNAITCMHLVEHLQGIDLLMREIARLLAPGGRVYFETPHPKTLNVPSAKGKVAFTLNFFDDPTHVKIVTTEELAAGAKREGLEVVGSGISRNWIFAASHPIFALLPPSRKKFTAQIHWLGWSAYLVARKTG